jgi:hypothetical protein
MKTLKKRKYYRYVGKQNPKYLNDTVLFMRKVLSLGELLNEIQFSNGTIYSNVPNDDLEILSTYELRRSERTFI